MSNNATPGRINEFAAHNLSRYTAYDRRIVSKLAMSEASLRYYRTHCNRRRRRCCCARGEFRVARDVTRLPATCGLRLRLRLRVGVCVCLCLVCWPARWRETDLLRPPTDRLPSCIDVFHTGSLPILASSRDSCPFHLSFLLLKSGLRPRRYGHRYHLLIAMARKTTPPRVGAVGSVPPGGNPNVAPPPIIQFDDDVDQARKGKLTRNQRLNRQQRGKKRGGVISWLVNFGFKVGVFYLLIGALWSCGSQPFRFDYKLNDSRSHCRALAQTKLHLQPIVSPYVDAAHAKVQPYTQPYLDAASPYAKLAWKNTRPYYRYASKQGKLAYNRHVEPARKLALKRGRAYVDPHVKTAQAHYKKQIQPHVNNVQRAVKPWQDV